MLKSHGTPRLVIQQYRPRQILSLQIYTVIFRILPGFNQSQEWRIEGDNYIVHSIVIHNFKKLGLISRSYHLVSKP